MNSEPGTKLIAHRNASSFVFMGPGFRRNDYECLEFPS